MSTAAVLFLGAASLAFGSGSTFTWSSTQASLTSAGIYDNEGRLVRVLWTMEHLPSGTYQSNWDGLNDQGQPVPPGAYDWKVVQNRSTYTNIGTVGNTGQPENSFGHVPFFLEGVAVDAQDRIYSVHDWNEAGHDVKRWSSETGMATFHSAHIVNDALLKAIAVEPDGTRAYVTGYAGDPTNRANVKFSVFRLRLSEQNGGYIEDFSQAGRCIEIYHGNAEYPAWATPADIEVMKVPLISIALQGDSLYVTDALAGRLLKYHKSTGAHQMTIPDVPLACGVAVTPDGKIWVGREHSKVGVYDSDGTLLATPITDLADVRALSIQGNSLVVADRAGEIRRYEIDGVLATPAGTFGLAARPGDRAPERLAKVQGMVLDSQGNVIVSDRMGAGSRLQKFSAQNTPVWQQMGLEFSSQAAYGKDNPDFLISSYRNLYELDKATGRWSLLGPGGTDEAGSYFGHFESTHFGPPRVVRLGGNDFFYYPAGDSVAVYRVAPPADSERGPTLKLVSVLASSQPAPDGSTRTQLWLDENKFLWSWDDAEGDHEIDYTSAGEPEEVTLDASPGSPEGWKWDKASFGVDDAGWIWLASYARIIPPGPFEAKAIYAIPPRGLNALGNPVYRWADAVKVMDEATGRSAAGMSAGQEFNWMMVNRSDDGMVYSLAYGDRPGLPQDGARWMGGNLLVGFSGQTGNQPQSLGQPKWTVVLPERSVGMTPIPGGAGGVFVGVGPVNRGTIGHYTRDGLLIGTFSVAPAYGDATLPNLASGAFDSFMALNCNRDPRDGLVDVFAEDNWNQRLVWHRVDDSAVEVRSGSVLVSGGSGEGLSSLTVNGGTGDGSYVPGTSVSVVAATPPAGKMFVAWTGDVSGLADAGAAATSFTISSGNATITATYDWATGADKIRFHPREGDEHRLLNCVFEGTDGDPVSGPYQPFYVVSAVPEAGWTEVIVETGTYRYLRYRDPNHNGMIAEIEFYRDGVKLEGTGFGTAGAWNDEAHHTFEAALDGLPSTYFNGPAGKNAYIGIDTKSLATHTLTVNGGSGSGSYEPGTQVLVSAAAPSTGMQFEAWSGDTAILSNPFLSTTSATIPFQDVTVTATYASVPPAPVLGRAFLRREHGVGNVIDLDVFGTASLTNVEPRQSAPGGGHTLGLVFDQTVTTGAVAVVQGTGTVASVQFSGSTALVEFTGVADRQKLVVELSGFANGNGLPLNAVRIPVRFLMGDCSRDGQVVTSDALVIRSSNGKSVGDAGFEPVADVSTDGAVNTTDLNMMKINYGYSVAP